MQDQALVNWALSSLLAGLRIAPAFAFAPPFSLIRLPLFFRVLLGLGLSASIASVSPGVSTADFAPGWLVAAALRELVLGMVFVLAFQLAFAALQLAGRTIDIQVGFGLASLIDPNTRTQVPLIGSLFTYAAGAVFFAMDGHLELARIFAASFEAIPVTAAMAPLNMRALTQFISVVFITGLGVGGGVILSLFVTDLAIAMLSRTTPQMNVLVLGFQVKTLVLLLTLPAAFGLGGALFARMTRLTLDALPRLV